MKIRKKFLGMHAHRYRQNPLERAFAASWQDTNDSQHRTTLDYLMDSTNRGEPVPSLTARDWLVASTVLQWLGSPVGQTFLIQILKTKAGKWLRAELARQLELEAP
jgi:hypothetical protein